MLAVSDRHQPRRGLAIAGVRSGRWADARRKLADECVGHCEKPSHSPARPKPLATMLDAVSAGSRVVLA